MIQVKQGQLNFTGNFSIWGHSFLLGLWWWNFTPSSHVSCFSRTKLRNLSEQMWRHVCLLAFPFFIEISW
jgi:hypothetical protein